jgi:hypothetical protein
MEDDNPAATRVVEVALPNGTVGLMQVRDIDGGGAEKVGWQDRFDFTGVADTLDGVADALRDSMARARPGKVTVELGIELAVKSGKLTGLVVEGNAKATLKVTLEWSATPPAGRPRLRPLRRSDARSWPRR